MPSVVESIAAPDAAAEAAPLRLAEVAPDDIEDALATMDGTRDFLDQFRQKNRSCKRPLAWVTVARVHDQPGSLRLISGTYSSPNLVLTQAPLRVAIPYPAPYETGRGELRVLHDQSGATVALSPVWHVPAQAGASAHSVSWLAGPGCTPGTN